jgi:hypothetical protein
MKPRKCDDNNPKVVLRKFDWDGRFIEISLCDQHKQDLDFSHFVKEEKI